MNACHHYQDLVPGYVDGELSEEQAAPLRQHLLSCRVCRNAAQDLNKLTKWFPRPPVVAIPEGFAARVAAAAFAGAAPRQVQAAPPVRREVVAETSQEPRVLAFVLTLTSLAAGLLLTLALLLAQRDEPKGARMSAEPLPSILQELERINNGIPGEPGP